MSAVITGTGAVTSVGRDVDETFARLCAGHSGLAELRGFDRERFRAQYAYEIDNRPAEATDVPLRATHWLLDVLSAALADAGMSEDLSGTPVLIGTTLRELRSVELNWRDGMPFASEDLHFGTALRERFDADQTYTVANACSASLYALALGMDLLTLHEADTVVVAGVDTITESTYGLLDRVYREAPESVRPFDRARRGMLQGDGAAAVVLRRESEVRPGHRAHARLRGVGANCDAYHPSAPDSSSIERAIRDAYGRAGVKPADIDVVLLHGTGTPLNDEAEAEALRRVFQGVPDTPRMTAIKSMTGHTAGASGLHSLITAIESLKSGTVPPTLGLDDPIEEAANLRLARTTESGAELAVAQVNSFGFGGLNAVAVVERAT